MLVFAAALPVYSATISMMAIEVSENGRGDKRTVNNWESGMMDMFYNAGYIISNSRSIILDRYPFETNPEINQETDPKTISETIPPEIEADFVEAEEGSVDYFILTLLEYDAKNGLGTARPARITLRLYNVSGKTFIIEEKYSWFKSKERDDFAANIKRAVFMLIPYMGGLGGTL
jgi:hypothetical protein